MKKIVCLDFDGVIHSYTSGWQGPRTISDPPVPGAMEFIVRLQDAGYTVAVFSSRSRYWFGKAAMRRYIRFALLCQLEADDDIWRATRFESALFGRALKLGAFTIEPWDVVVSDTIEDIMDDIDFPSEKPPAHLTIDDRAMQFTGKWPSLQDVADFKPWNKGGSVA